MDLELIIRELYEERRRIERAIIHLERRLHKRVAEPRGRKSMSEEERAEVSKRMKSYWADRRSNDAKSVSKSQMPHVHVRLFDIPELDDDHLALGYVIAELEACIENNSPITEVANIAGRVVEATRGHFAREEEMMSRYGYGHLAKHHEFHRDLIADIEAIAGELTAHETKLDTDLIAKLWRLEMAHIDTADREYAEYFQTQQIDSTQQNRE